MKKTIAISMAFASVALADSVTLLPQLNDITNISDSKVNDVSWIGGKDGSTFETLISAEAIANNIVSDYGRCMQTTGWYGSTDNLHTGATLGFAVAPSKDGFSFTERGAYGGTFVMASVEVAELLSGSEGTVESFTLSFMATSTTLNFSAWSWNGSQATELVANAAVSTTSVNTYKVDVVPEDSKTLLFYFHGTGYGSTASVSALTSSADVNLVPEPTTASLSLLALCGLAARRRRK